MGIFPTEYTETPIILNSYYTYMRYPLVEVSRVVENYNDLLKAANGLQNPLYVESLETSSECSEEDIEQILITMQRMKLRLEKGDQKYTDLPKEIDACVKQIQDVKPEILG